MTLKTEVESIILRFNRLEGSLSDLKVELSEIQHEVDKEYAKEIVIEYGAVYNWNLDVRYNHQYVLARSGNNDKCWTFTSIFGFGFLPEQKVMTKDEITAFVIGFVRKGDIKFIGMARDIVTVNIPKKEKKK